MKTIKNNIMKYSAVFIFLIVLASILRPMEVQAQIIDPMKEYTNPDEIVTFDKSTTYEEAIQIIDTFSQEYENKFIVDNSGYKGEIGVNLPPMHWKDALNYIMRFQDLELVEEDEFYEIIVPEPETTSGAQQGSSGGSAAAEPVAIADTETQEIRINATFFEGNKRALQEIGIDWSTLTSDVPEDVSGFVSGTQGEGLPSTNFGDQFVSVNSFNAQSVSQNAFNALVNLGEIGPGISVQALFSAFEADNLGKVLATPSIKVVDGQEGNIQVGQDFSIKQRDIAGNVTDNFVSTGTILTVTPQIIRNGDTSFVYLDLSVERSTVQPDVVSTIINKQQAATSAILLNGESTYVAGLYRTEETAVRRGVPILKDLPGWFFGLKYLFGYNSKDFLENELIIIVQAEIIKPVSQRMSEKLATNREVLNTTRDDMRTNLDRVFAVTPPTDMPEPVMDTEMTATDSTATDSTDTILEEEVTEAASDSLDTQTEEEIVVEEPEIPADLTMPIDRPELMVVVPKAFNLDEFLAYQENEEDRSTDDVNNGDKYFVIGGSFLVPNNAQNFKTTLDQEGYDTRVLFNPVSRFNYVAYESYPDYKTAVDRAIAIRNTINSEAWIFTLQSNTKEIED